MESFVFTVQDLYDHYGEELQLQKTKAASAMKSKIVVPEVRHLGLSLAGYGKQKSDKSLLVFGRLELEYLKDLSQSVRIKRLKEVLSKKNPVIFISRNLQPPKELLTICLEYQITVFRSALPSMSLMTELTIILRGKFSPVYSCHGTLIEVFGVGVLIQGDSSVGKSETALGLIERGHRLISDDVVRIRKKEDDILEGSGPELNRHLLEIRGIGIINVAHLYGAVCVRERVNIDMIIHLEEWDEYHFYDRVGLEEKFKQILEVKVPSYILPVKIGRDVVLLLETTVLNHRLKGMGYHSAKDFNVKLLEEIAKRQKQKVGKKN